MPRTHKLLYANTLEIFPGGNSPAGGEIVFEISYTYRDATRDYYSPSFGNYLPGDPADVEVLSVALVRAGETLEAPEWLRDLILSVVDDDTLAEHAAGELV